MIKIHIKCINGEAFDVTVNSMSHVYLSITRLIITDGNGLVIFKDNLTNIKEIIIKLL